MTAETDQCGVVTEEIVFGEDDTAELVLTVNCPPTEQEVVEEDDESVTDDNESADRDDDGEELAETGFGVAVPNLLIAASLLCIGGVIVGLSRRHVSP